MRRLYIEAAFVVAALLVGAVYGANAEANNRRENDKVCRSIVYEWRMPVESISEVECKRICSARERQRLY